MMISAEHNKYRFKGNYFIVPHELERDILSSMPYSAFCIFVALLSLGNRYGSTFYFPDKQFEERYSISRKTLIKTRKLLKEHGYIDYKPGHIEGSLSIATSYTLLPDSLMRSKYGMIPRGP